ncbi:MAG TPA: hypothetical protein VJ608_04070 [Albitalea sp.]|nr:hypothetical protein [Albitalea sp.]
MQADWDRLPFANERELQRFVIRNAKSLLGIDVVASTLPRGRSLHKIDILGVSDAGRIWVIECKHDLIDEHAIAQLGMYRDALLADWTSVERRVAESRGPNLSVTKEAPILVAIGYRCASGAAGASVETLLFQYLDEAFDRFVDSQSPGVVCLAPAADSGVHAKPHPEVLKTRSAERRMAGLPTEVRRKFWHIDGLMRKIDGIRPRYAGKKVPIVASYRRTRRPCITATVEGDRIVWRARESTRLTMRMGAETDVAEVVEALLRAARAL